MYIFEVGGREGMGKGLGMGYHNFCVHTIVTSIHTRLTRKKELNNFKTTNCITMYTVVLGTRPKGSSRT